MFFKIGCHHLLFTRLAVKESHDDRYSPDRKEAMLSKLLPPYNLTAAEPARQEGISEATLYSWRKQAKLEGRPVPGRTHK